jgi:hypothetical protein
VKELNLYINETLLFALLALGLMSGEITAQRAGLSDSDQDLPDALRLRHHRSRLKPWDLAIIQVRRSAQGKRICKYLGGISHEAFCSDDNPACRLGV